MEEIIAPDFGESVFEASVGRWFKQNGELVAVGDPIVELHTDKAVQEINAVKGGVIINILKQVDDVVHPGDALCEFQSEDSVAAIEQAVAEAAAGAETTEAETDVSDAETVDDAATVNEPTDNADAEISDEASDADAVEDAVAVDDASDSDSDAETEPDTEDGDDEFVEIQFGASALAGTGFVEMPAVEGAEPTSVVEPTVDEAEEPASHDDTGDETVATESDDAEAEVEVTEPADDGGDAEEPEDSEDEADVAAESEVESQPEPEPEPAQPEPVPAVDTRVAELARAVDEKPTRRERLSRRRLTIARRMSEVQSEAVMTTTYNEVDMHEVIRIRHELGAQFLERHDTKLGFMSFFVKAVVSGLKAFPILNSELGDDELIYKEYYDIGIAVASDHGLVVPVVRDADDASFAEIERAIRGFAVTAQSGAVQLAALVGGTFTITNGGVFGSMMSTPILNPPQVGILGMHNIVDRPVVVDGEIAIRPMMYLAVTYDHRVVEGAHAVQFLMRVKQSLEDAQTLMMVG